MLPVNSATMEWLAMQGGVPRITLPSGERIDRPNLEWVVEQLRWRFLMDSYEGGERYRNAIYNYDLRGLPIRNLIRHKREYPAMVDQNGWPIQVGRPPGTDQAAQATDDDYELRRARTPIPTFMGEAVGEHVSKIYNQEVKRSGPKPLEDWWRDVDGSGTTIDEWMADVAAPLFLVFGQLDVFIDRPPAPAGETVSSRADEIRLGLDSAVVSYVLPQNLPWWKTDRLGRYVECLVRETDDAGKATFRYWTDSDWTLYAENGDRIDGPTPHPYGRVPIQRAFDRKRPSAKHIGMPRYETIAEIQREYYNRDSELILSDTLQAHPVVQMPRTLLEEKDGGVTFGPGYVMPMEKGLDGSFTPNLVLDYPKGAADSLRTNKSDLRDASDRAACLTKPVGTAGTTGDTVGQSAASKRIDQSTGNELLGKIAAALERFERAVAELTLAVLGVSFDPEAVAIQYPREFDLWSADELGAAIQAFELILSQAGDAPTTEGVMLSKLVRLMLVGCDDELYAEMDAEIADVLEQRRKDRQAMREAMPAVVPDASEPDADDATSASAPSPVPAVASDESKPVE